MDDNDNGRPDASEVAEFDLIVTNEGTVTLELRSINDDTLSSGCTLSETLLLKQGEQHKCTVSREVRGSACLQLVEFRHGKKRDVRVF